MTFFLSQLTMDNVDHLRVTAKWKWLAAVNVFNFEHCGHLSFHLDSKILFFFCVYSKSTLCRVHCLSAGFLYASQSCRIIANYAATVHTDAESYFGQKINHFFYFPFRLRCGIFLIGCMLQYARGHVCGPDRQMWHFFSINSMTLAIMSDSTVAPQH
jgi:hypothetical protein